MKQIIAAAIMALSLSACVSYVPAQYADEPGVVVQTDYYVGYYNPGFGYWTGWGWDPYFYSYGHRGYGHRYYAPRGWHGGHSVNSHRWHH